MEEDECEEEESSRWWEQVNTPCLNHSQTGRYSIYLPWRDGRL